MDERNDNHWVGTWATAPVPVGGIALVGQTVRMISRISIGGSRLRVRISNAYGAGDLAVGAAHLGLRSHGAVIVDGSGRPLTFNGSPSTTVPAGATVVSDPVVLDVAPLSDLAVSVYLPGEVPESFQLTGHDPAHQTNYSSPAGNFTAATEMPVQEETEVFLFVTGIEVLAPRVVGGIVAFGDSLTEGNLSELDANNRWPDQLARRLVAAQGRQLGVVNQGIGGGRMLHDGPGDNGLRRFDRDVLAQPGVTHVVVLLSVNDLRKQPEKGRRDRQRRRSDRRAEPARRASARRRAHSLRRDGADMGDALLFVFCAEALRFLLPPHATIKALPPAIRAAPTPLSIVRRVPRPTPCEAP
jgi:hypothetical protein